MRIKKLELVGFKSFKDRTVIHFDAGITGIVGPNGCGKSNIVDALRWVMGEMSAKHLRGSAMEDVIFAGSDGYAPMGMAEVSLTLENDGGPFPAQYSKNSEIMLTRRLHRSGESEYLINREPARLKDVQEVFMDTGAGSKGFSMVEQGAIGKIITAKPEERRTLIEEAAGITKFKVRKRESQRKLEATDQNLVRLQDIIGELKRQLGSLERQAQRAERYRKLKQEIEELELWVSSRQYLTLKSQAFDAQAEFDQARESEVSSASEFSAMELRMQQIKAELAEQESKVSTLQTGHFDVKTAVQKKELTIRELQFEIEQARRSNEMTGSLLQQNSARRDLLERDRQDLSGRLDSMRLEAEKLSAEFTEKNVEYKQHQTRIQECDDLLTNHRREMLTVSQGESHLDAKVNSSEEQLSSVREREQSARAILLELEEKKREFETRRNQVFNRLESERQMQLAMMQDVENFVANQAALKSQLDERRTELEQFKDQLNEVTSRLYGLEDLQSNFEGFETGVKSVMMWQRQRAQAHVDGQVEMQFRPVAEVVEVPPEFETAMEAALGGRLQMLLANGDAPLSAVEYLKENRSGRSSFMSSEWVAQADARDTSAILSEPGVRASLQNVVQVPEQHRATVSYILKDVIVVDSIRTALRLRPQYAGFSFVTTEGDTLMSDGVLTGGAAEAAESGVLKRRREIKDLSARREEASGKLQLAQAVLKKLEAQYETVTEDLQNAQRANTEKEILLAELKKDLERAENELQSAQTAIARQQREVGQIQEQGLRLQEQQTELRERLTELREKRVGLEAQIESLGQELQTKRQGIDSLQAEVTQLQVQAASKNQEVEGLTRQLHMIEKSLAEVEAQLAHMNKETDKNTQALSDHQRQLEEEKIGLERMVHEAQEMESRLSQARDQFEQMLTGSRELEKKVSEGYHERSQLQAKMNEAQLRLEQARMREQNLISQVRERYMQDLVTMAETWAQREGDLGQAEESLRDLKDKISKIGEVNLSAIEEFDDIKKRYEFLSQQQTDLVEAKEQLRKVIDRINRICSRRFKETFDAVNERFTKVFPVLFGGGEAKLILIEDPEKGEMGIDIVAKPPGKKLQSVSLMSGGEKALTAVALIFSIFLVKPSPYCLLDEVDAPLDDANVFRFNDLVKEMAKRSQIILVTHNKHTMEVSEKLYGVTMQEKGVSKMVSVSLADAQKAI